MSDVDAADGLVSSWLAPLPDEGAPCGADLEYDNDFLALTSAAAGKPESQFSAAEPPNWREVVGQAEAMFERTRDLRIAIFWTRGMLHLHGYVALAPGLRLVAGLLRDHWEHVHPLPDPDDGDPFARINALTVLRESEGLVGDLRVTRVVADRAVGELTGRMVEVALGLSPLRTGESDPGRSLIQQMLAAALERTPQLRAACRGATEALRELNTLQQDRLSGDGPDLKPLRVLVEGIEGLLPPEDTAAEEEAADGQAEGGGGGGPARAPRGLSGEVTSREEAIRAIDKVCEYLERTEPTNPAPLFLRRAKQLINHNFLQLMKILAPDSLGEVAKVVGIDPDSVETPGDS